jgi:hypothetical protein
MYYTQDHLAYLAKVDDELLMAGHVSNFSTTTFDLRNVVHAADVDMNPIYIHMGINGTPDTYCHPSDSLVNYRTYPTVSGDSIVSTMVVHQGEDGCHQVNIMKVVPGKCKAEKILHNFNGQQARYYQFTKHGSSYQVPAERKAPLQPIYYNGTILSVMEAVMVASYTPSSRNG